MNHSLSIAAEPQARRVGQRSAGTVQQRWVLSPGLDGLLIIAAPVLCLLLAIAAFALLPVERAATLVLVTHVVLTVAHHLPTYIRLYGDLDTFNGDRWRWLLMPLLPFGLSLAVLIYLRTQDYGLEQFFYLFILLTLWDPWHFLMQHYGFMRIYDRGNAAPRALAAGMDRMVCSAWMLYLLLASSAWLPELLQDLDARLAVPLLLVLPAGAVDAMTAAAAMIATVASIAYAGYLLWCWRRGWFVSPAKVALLVLTFGVMWLSYTPNTLIREWAPGWSFKVGFATVGIVHMTQYLAIVWRYNRNLATRPEAARAGWFRWLHSRNTLWAAALYVIACIAYGEGLTTDFQTDWITIPVLALGFTSTLMHYYFDGFIWKLRKPGTAATLDGSAPGLAADRGPATHRGPTLREWLRPLLVFGLPLGLMTTVAAASWAPPQPAYTETLKQAVQAARAGDRELAIREARRALLAMDRELPAVRALARLEDASPRDAQLALLLYSHRWVQYTLLPQLSGRDDVERLVLQRDGIVEPLQILDRALARGGSVAHPGHETMTPEEARRLRDGWSRQMQQLDEQLARLAP